MMQGSLYSAKVLLKSPKEQYWSFFRPREYFFGLRLEQVKLRGLGIRDRRFRV